MASIPTPSPPAARSLLTAAMIAVGCGVAAALVILGVVGDVVFAAGFVAAAIVLAGTVVVLRSAFAPAAAAEIDIDWSVARALAAASPDAVAVTDRAGRLVCANDRYQAVFNGYPTPPNLPVGEAESQRLQTPGGRHGVTAVLTSSG